MAAGTGPCWRAWERHTECRRENGDQGFAREMVVLSCRHLRKVTTEHANRGSSGPIASPTGLGLGLALPIISVRGTPLTPPVKPKHQVATATRRTNQPAVTSVCMISGDEWFASISEAQLDSSWRRPPCAV